MRTCNTTKFMQTVDGFEVFGVGAEQVRGWCGWRGRKVTGKLDTGTYCDTLRKGAWLVVSNHASFGHMGGTPMVLWAGCKRDALAIARAQVRGAKSSFDYAGICFGVEIWRVYGDDELWGDWDYAAACSLEPDDGDFDELADDAYPFGDCWESCYKACRPDPDFVASGDDYAICAGVAEPYMRGNCEGMHLVEHVVGHAGNFEEACYLCDHWHGLLTDGDYYVGVWVRFGDDGPKVYERHSWGDGHFDA